MNFVLPMLTFVAVLFGVTLAHAQGLESRWNDANAAYAAGDYEAAVAGYRALEDAGVIDPDVAANLGAAYARSEQYGWAILQFERSLAIAPAQDRAEEIEATLESVSAVLKDEITRRYGAVETTRATGFADAVSSGIPEPVLAIVVALLWIALFVVLLVRLRLEDRQRFIASVTAVLLLAASASFAILLLAKRGALSDGERGIIVATNGELLEGPDPRAVPRGPAMEGDRIAILARDGEYLQVRTSDGRVGWIDNEGAKPIIAAAQ